MAVFFAKCAGMLKKEFVEQAAIALFVNGSLAQQERLIRIK